MAKEDLITLEGTVQKVKPNTVFDVEVETKDGSHLVNCTLSGKLRLNNIMIVTGDKVTITVSPYDLKNGRIIWRNK